ncbi:Uma2 family endonuclease [Sorangium sp. So ce131]|uniref:Uma2 family endonuclease n=1 Tax=Sorangium sp. So ce131 TaxID=3133282 RepID=UPI003F606104
MLATGKPAALRRHRRAPSPLHFPDHATVPETKRHLELRTLLYLVLKTFADRHTIGSDQFVYWLASNPRRCLAPDAFVRLGTPDTTFRSWKTWERGAPELAVEIVSESDDDATDWDEKLDRYHELGVLELVRFDPAAPEGHRLRVWDRLQGDLVEREVEADHAACDVLGLHWVVVPLEEMPAALRLARDPQGRDLVLTSEEAAEARAKAAERRIAELEAELRRQRGG